MCSDFTNHTITKTLTIAQWVAIRAAILELQLLLAAPISPPESQ